MFKKLYKKLDDLAELIKNNFSQQGKEHYSTREMINGKTMNISSRIDKLISTINSQQRTIEQLTNALKDKYEHGLFIFSEDCKRPMVIRNGEEITSKFTSHFSISWSHDEGISMETECFVGTFSDMK
jgi:hypothetical protein